MTSVVASCSTIQHMTPAYRHAQERHQMLLRLQLDTMRFSDVYRSRVVGAVNQIQATEVTPEERLLLQTWKVGQVEAVYTNAGGPNPALNCLDVVVLATMSRMVIDDVDRQYGDRTHLLQKTHHDLEEGAWEVAKPILSDAQAVQLRDMIARWRARNPMVRSVVITHFAELANSIGEPGAEGAEKSESIFSIMNLNPFAQLDPAVQQLALSRNLGERAIFYLQRMPYIAAQRAEQVAYELAVQPETREMLASAQRVSYVGSAADTLATNLPTMLDKQRDALVAQLSQQISRQSATIGELSGNLRSTLEAGTATADALNTMLQSLNQLTAQFAASGLIPKTPGQPGHPPFDIRNYTEALHAATETAQQLSVLTQQLNTATPAVRSATQGLIDHTIGMLAVLILGTFSTALAYRAIVLRMQRHLP
jgi:hypothetical protein